MLKKLSNLFLLLALTHTAFAATDLCKSLTGTWIGTGNDSAGLLDSPFPFSLQLKYKNGMVYGYTQQVNTNNGKYVTFGKANGDFLFFATCKNSVLSNSYFISNIANTTTQQACGVPNTQGFTLTSTTNLTNFPISYENAMTGTLFRANLTKQTNNTKADPSLLKQAMKLSNGNINSCS